MVCWPCVTATRIIDFDNFFSELPREVDDAPALIGRAIDTQISQSLFQLPIPGAEGGGDNMLAFRNLLRAKFYDMPSGEAVAEAMGVPEELIIRDLENSEARRCRCTSCAKPEDDPVGQNWVRWPDRGGGVVDLLRVDGVANKVQEPNLPDVSGGDFRIGDLLVAADQPPRKTSATAGGRHPAGGQVDHLHRRLHQGEWVLRWRMRHRRRSCATHQVGPTSSTPGIEISTFDNLIPLGSQARPSRMCTTETWLRVQHCRRC